MFFLKFSVPLLEAAVTVTVVVVATQAVAHMEAA